MTREHRRASDPPSTLPNPYDEQALQDAALDTIANYHR
jgi:hypothetical protein